MAFIAILSSSLPILGGKGTHMGRPPPPSYYKFLDPPLFTGMQEIEN